MNASRKWKQVNLGDLIDTQKGFAFKSTWYCDTGRPIVKVSDFTQNSVDASSLTKVPDEIAEKYLRYELRERDVVIQTVGSWPTNPASVVGKCIRVPRTAHKALLNQNSVRLSPGNEVEKRYLYYCLRSSQFSNYIVGTAQGAASQAAITLDAIRTYALSLPPLPTQRKIAAILSAYDD
jgi:type I restriction enzyme S subunit